MRHFIIYIDRFGGLELAAESVGLDAGVKNSGGTRSVNHTPLSVTWNVETLLCMVRASTL
jgi:hypothetical protein